MLDTNVCIDVIRQRSRAVIDRIRSHGTDDIAVSAITLSELQHGVFKSESPEQNRVALLEFLVPFSVLSYEDAAAKIYGEIRAQLEKRGSPIEPLDMLIAAHALSRGLTLVTDNEREFRRVPGLSIENWVGS